MKKSGYILILAALFIGVAKLLDTINFWSLAGIERPHGYIVQGLIFLTLLFILQNFLFIPYLRVMEEREAQTTGKAAAAEKTRQEAEAMIQKYRLSIEEARLGAIKMREEQGAKADEEEHARIVKAKESAKANYETSLKQTEREATAAREQLRGSVESLSAEIIAHVVNVGATVAKVKRG